MGKTETPRNPSPLFGAERIALIAAIIALVPLSFLAWHILQPGPGTPYRYLIISVAVPESENDLEGQSSPPQIYLDMRYDDYSPLWAGVYKDWDSLSGPEKAGRIDGLFRNTAGTILPIADKTAFTNALADALERQNLFLCYQPVGMDNPICGAYREEVRHNLDEFKLLNWFLRQDAKLTVMPLVGP